MSKFTLKQYCRTEKGKKEKASVEDFKVEAEDFRGAAAQVSDKKECKGKAFYVHDADDKPVYSFAVAGKK